MKAIIKDFTDYSKQGKLCDGGGKDIKLKPSFFAMRELTDEDVSSMNEWEDVAYKKDGLTFIKNLYVDPKSLKSYRILGEVSSTASKFVKEGEEVEIDDNPDLNLLDGKKVTRTVKCPTCETHN